MTLKLVVKSQACGEIEELLLSESSYSIGRLHDNDLSVQRECVSGYHAEVRRTSDGGYAIIDLKSTNGTFLNENRVTSPEQVKPGDRLKLGDLLIMVEEHIELVLQPENESLPGGASSKVISLKDDFEFASGESFNTNPITPMRTPPPMTNGNGVHTHLGRMGDPLAESELAARLAERIREAQRAREAERAEIERAQEAERAKQAELAREAERAKQAELAREAERAEQIERAKEVERLQQIERAKEAERLQQIERAKEAERLQQMERAKEAERLQQIERAKEAERLQQIERAKEAERVQQIERAREAERVQQIERAKEAERLQQIERAKEAERLQQIERAREAERLQQIERAKEAERLQQIERAKEAERVQQIERAKEAERVQQIERTKEAERVQQMERAKEAERVQQIERAREAERAQQIERAREAERAQQIERAREAERARQMERARAAERAEVDLRERPEPAGNDDFGSKLQILTSQLERAMQEIRRLKAFIANESPKPAGTNGHAAVPANSGQPMARVREESAIRSSVTNDRNGVPAGPERELREGNREEVRAASHAVSPIQRQPPENAVAFRSVGEVPSHPGIHLRPQIDVARSVAERPAGNEVGPREVSVRPIE